MKKIKSKLIYINNQHKKLEKQLKSPSPDSKTRSRIPSTQSPIKQIQQFYSHPLVNPYYSGLYKQKATANKYMSKQPLSFSLYQNSSTFVDTDEISQHIKIRSPEQVGHRKVNSLFYGEIQHKQSIQRKNNQNLSALYLENTAKIQRKQQDSRKINQNRITSIKFGKKLQIYSTPKSKKQDASIINQKDNFQSLYIPSPKRQSTQSRQQMQKQQMQRQQIQQLKYQNGYLLQKLQQKQVQICQLQSYFSQYQKLREKNHYLQQQMKRVISSAVNSQQQEFILHSKKLAPSINKITNHQYIKISQLQDQTSDRYQDNSLVYNTYHQDEYNTQYNKNHKRMLSVGARLKQSVMRNFQHSTNISEQYLHDSQNYDFQKKNVKTQETQDFQQPEYSTKKKRSLFVTKKKNGNQQNIDILVETNKKLSQIIQKLTLNNQNLSVQLNRSQQKLSTIEIKLQTWQTQLTFISSHIHQISTFPIKNNLNNNLTNIRLNLSNIEQNVNKLIISMDQNGKKINRSRSQKKLSDSYQQRIRKYSRQNQIIQSPTFSYIDHGYDHNQQSFRLSYSDRDNSPNTKIKNNQPNEVDLRNSENPAIRLLENKQPIYVSNTQSIQQSNQSDPLSKDSNLTSQFLEPQLCHRSKMSSENSQVNINFEDIYQNSSQLNHYTLTSLTINPTQTLIKKSLKGSFGPIVLQKQMSVSQKGDYISNQNQNQHHSHTKLNRPRQNSSINIFFSTDSIGKTQTKYRSPFTHHVQEEDQNQKTDDNPIQQSSLQIYNQSQTVSRLNMQAMQMRKLIHNLTQQRDQLKKQMKTKIEVIDELQISLKQITSMSSIPSPSKTNQPYNLSNNMMLSSPNQMQFALMKSPQNITNRMFGLKQIQLQIQRQLKENQLESQILGREDENFNKTKNMLIRLISIIKVFVRDNQIKIINPTI